MKIPYRAVHVDARFSIREVALIHFRSFFVEQIAQIGDDSLQILFCSLLVIVLGLSMEK